MNLERYLMVQGISLSPVPGALELRQMANDIQEGICTPMEWELTGAPIVILPPTSDTNPPNPAETTWAADLQRYNCIEEH
ncbi:hypothetical protein RUND412_002029 [Rhizina undulata]